MREKLSRAIVLMLLIVLTSVNGHAYDDGDFQIWNTDSEEFKINDNSKAVLEQEFRWADNANEFCYHHYEAGFFYSLKRYLNVGLGYRHIYELNRGKFKLEKEPFLTAALSWDLNGFRIEDRSRMEYRYFDYQVDSWRYRNKLGVKFPWKFTSMEIQPYLSDEIFVGFGATNQFNRNRFSSGVGMSISKNIKGELYYMLQDSKSAGKWTDINILGTKIKIAF
ncbi:MAG: DUF2490 domain-containing protein [Candidatus Omnitrophota bacterium]